MKKQEIDMCLKELNLQAGEYYILSGASLVIRGIREECSDLDLCMTKEAFEKIKLCYNVKHLDGKPENVFQISENIETFVEPEEAFKYEIVEKYPLEDLERILTFKKERNQEKDKKDILQIEKYLKELKQEISCGAFVLDGNSVLLVQHNAGHWDFPKGHVEKGETFEETAKREVLEETGIEIEIVSKKQKITRNKPKLKIQKKVIFFEAKKIGGKIKRQESEIQYVEWVKQQDVCNKLTYEKSRKCFSELLENKQ